MQTLRGSVATVRSGNRSDDSDRSSKKSEENDRTVWRLGRGLSKLCEWWDWVGKKKKGAESAMRSWGWRRWRKTMVALLGDRRCLFWGMRNWVKVFFFIIFYFEFSLFIVRVEWFDITWHFTHRTSLRRPPRQITLHFTPPLNPF